MDENVCLRLFEALQSFAVEQAGPGTVFREADR